MGDAGEGLVDAEARIQERLEELESARAEKRAQQTIRDPEALRTMETLKLARAEFQRQLESTAHERRRAQIVDAIAEVDRRIADLSGRLA